MLSIWRLCARVTVAVQLLNILGLNIDRTFGFSNWTHAMFGAPMHLRTIYQRILEFVKCSIAYRCDRDASHRCRCVRANVSECLFFYRENDETIDSFVIENTPVM